MVQDFCVFVQLSDKQTLVCKSSWISHICCICFAFALLKIKWTLPPECSRVLKTQTPHIVLNNSTWLNDWSVMVVSRVSTSGQECHRGVADSPECPRFWTKTVSFCGKVGHIYIWNSDCRWLWIDGHAEVSSDMTFAAILQLLSPTDMFSCVCKHACARLFPSVYHCVAPIPVLPKAAAMADSASTTL